MVIVCTNEIANARNNHKRETARYDEKKKYTSKSKFF